MTKKRLLNIKALGIMGAGMLFLLGACSTDPEQSTEAASTTEAGTSVDTETTASKDMEVQKAGKVFYMIPSPLELSSIIKNAGATYDNSVLNPSEYVSNYVTSGSQALNLGVYGADLSYSSIFEQTQETSKYFMAAKELADEFGITSAFGKSTVDRIQNNLNNRDSLIAIISDSYWEADAYLKENSRSNTSALVIAGGWIEALYISTKLAGKTNTNSEIISRIGEQKLTLNNLIPMLEKFTGDDVDEVVNSLKDLQETFMGVEITYERKESITNSETQLTTIQTTSKINIDEEQLASISDKVESIRTNIVMPSGN
jgi:hypothetical protein